LAWNQNNVSDW